jgi:hypothetical protein
MTDLERVLFLISAASSAKDPRVRGWYASEARAQLMEAKARIDGLALSLEAIERELARIDNPYAERLTP